MSYTAVVPHSTDIRSRPSGMRFRLKKGFFTRVVDCGIFTPGRFCLFLQ